MEHPNGKLYAYESTQNVLPYLALFLVGIPYILSLFSLVLLTKELFLITPTNASDVVSLLMVSCICFFAGSFFLPFLNLYPSFRVSEGGLNVQTFIFWWIFVPWADVKDIRTVRTGFSTSCLVIVAHLTFIHRLIGWSFGLTFQPAFLIKQTLSSYDEAIRILRKHTER